MNVLQTYTLKVKDKIIFDIHNRLAIDLSKSFDEQWEKFRKTKDDQLKDYYFLGDVCDVIYKLLMNEEKDFSSLNEYQNKIVTKAINDVIKEVIQKQELINIYCEYKPLND